MTGRCGNPLLCCGPVWARFRPAAAVSDWPPPLLGRLPHRPRSISAPPPIDRQTHRLVTARPAAASRESDRPPRMPSTDSDTEPDARTDSDNETDSAGRDDSSTRVDSAVRAARDALSAPDVDRATAVVVAMLGVDAVLWVLLYRGAVPMPGASWLMQQAGVPMAAPGAMELAAFHVGTVEAFAGYLVVWGVMMWAMMHPAMTRFTREYADAYRGGAGGAALSLASFMTGYHAVWLLSGVVPLTFHALLPGGILGFTAAHTHLVVGGVLVLTGLYQLTEFKQSLLRSCCARVAPHTDSVPEAVEEGLGHGVRCVTICFGPFFLLMPFFGEMNFFWMVALTAVVTVERLPVWGDDVATATGVVSLLAGLVVLAVRPDLGLRFATSMGM